jgi:predicted TIM-barrel fold metal-dependent hydrolase
MLEKANPSVMQPVIKEFSNTIFVLLHSSYPFTQEAGYLASVYKNVYRVYPRSPLAFLSSRLLSVDFGEVFPMVSRSGQLALLRQVLELTPTNKILWSSEHNLRLKCSLSNRVQSRRPLVARDVLSRRYTSARSSV